MKIEIKSWMTGSLLFEGDFSCIADAVKAAIKSSVDLRSVDLRFVDLRFADLRSANLSSADLRSADLSSADLRFADLSSANLSSANLRSADLSFGKIKNIERPFFQISPLGAEARQLLAFDTDKGICLMTGCFTGGVREFKIALAEKHGTNDTAKEYLLAIELIENHFKIWSE